ncbi:hypothetical protein [Chloroflexus sp.]|uniref:hypothetical protein n=1 Tax=Chloroflexus sp. TaxID=1904827 RepID=UPI004048FC32
MPQSRDRLAGEPSRLALPASIGTRPIRSIPAGRGYALLDRRRSIPQAWFSPDDAARRRRCGISEGPSFRTHQEPAWEMVEG